jgi:hypothetical protein
MTAPAINEVLRSAGLSLSLSPESALLVMPASRLTPELRELIRANKDELVAWQTQAELASWNAPATVAESGSSLATSDPRSIAPAEPNAPAPQENLSKPAIPVAANDPAQVAGLVTEPPNPDRLCWPHSSAMTGREIATFEARLHLFGSRGLDLKQAEAMADRLVLRDRELDDRRLCMECQHLQAQSAYHGRSWPELRCGNWKASGLSISVRQAGMSRDFAHQLQRCSGFKTVTP